MLDELPQLLEAGANDARELMRALSGPALRELELASEAELESLRQLVNRTSQRVAELERRISELEADEAGDTH